MPILDIELTRKLTDGRKRLLEIQAARQEADAQVRELARWIADTQARRDADAEVALLDNGRKPDARISTELEALTLRLHSSMARAKTAAGAALRQREIVEGIERTISSQHRALSLAAAKPHWDKWLKLTLEAAEEMRQFTDATLCERIEPQELCGFTADIMAVLCTMSRDSLDLLAVMALYDQRLANLLWGRGQAAAA